MLTNEPHRTASLETDSATKAMPARAEYRQPKLRKLDLAETEGASTGPADGALNLFSQN
jgi:hypothetical protein